MEDYKQVIIELPRQVELHQLLEEIKEISDLPRKTKIQLFSYFSLYLAMKELNYIEIVEEISKSVEKFNTNPKDIKLAEQIENLIPEFIKAIIRNPKLKIEALKLYEKEFATASPQQDNKESKEEKQAETSTITKDKEIELKIPSQETLKEIFKTTPELRYEQKFILPALLEHANEEIYAEGLILLLTTAFNNQFGILYPGIDSYLIKIIKVLVQDEKQQSATISLLKEIFQQPSKQN